MKKSLLLTGRETKSKGLILPFEKCYPAPMNNTDWKWQLQNRIDSPGKLPPGFKLTGGERRWFEALPRQAFPFLVTPYYLSLAAPADPGDPIRKQFMPSPREAIQMPYETPDPLGEENYTVAPGVIHRYTDRLLLHVTSACAVNCRHCFRRTFPANMSRNIDTESLEACCRYIENHPEVQEVLLSGGDPLILEDIKLRKILEKIKQSRNNIILRIGSRIPVVLPQRITASLVSILKSFHPLWISTHFNHPSEITAESRGAINMLTGAGIPVLNQTVLLRGINDDAETLAGLFRELVRNIIKPYYLFQGDLAPGTAHLRIPLKKAIALYGQLRGSLSGLALPKLAVDAPGGGGKIILNSLPPGEEGSYKLAGTDGRIYLYPVED